MASERKKKKKEKLNYFVYSYSIGGNYMPQGHEIYIEDHMLEEYGYINANGIQTYLESINSWLKNEICTYQEGKVRFSKYIDLLCREFDIEPIYILSLIQKEQSALFRETPPSDSVKIKICGYGYTETGVMKEFQGFDKQLYHAIKQLRRYDKHAPVINWEITDIVLYDSSSLLKREGYDYVKIRASTKAEAKSFRYNPRIEGIKNHGEIWNRVYSKCEELGIIQD